MIDEERQAYYTKPLLDSSVSYYNNHVLNQLNLEKFAFKVIFDLTRMSRFIID